MTKNTPKLPVVGTVVTIEWSGGIAQFLAQRDNTNVTML